jgi:hypothetical protein
MSKTEIAVDYRLPFRPDRPTLPFVENLYKSPRVNSSSTWESDAFNSRSLSFFPEGFSDGIPAGCLLPPRQKRMTACRSSSSLFLRSLITMLMVCSGLFVEVNITK